MTPKGLLVRAAAIALVYGLLHVAGARQCAAFLSGTPVGGTGALLAGVSYVVFHFAFIIVAPILGIAALLMALSRRWP